MADTRHPPGPEPGREHGHEHKENPQVSFERKDVNVFQITAFGIGLLISTLVAAFAMWGLFAWFYAREDRKNPPNPPGMMSQREKQPPAPRLQAAPTGELGSMHRDEEMILGSYGWVDASRGTVHIPIDQAMDIMAQKGLPSKPTAAGADHDGYRTIPSDASSGRTLEKISQ